MEQKKYYIDVIIKREMENNNKLIESYKKLILNLPKGSIYLKIINNKKYCYLKYREGKKSVLKYLGTENVMDDINNQIEKRKHYEKMIKKLEEENKHMIRMVSVK